MRMTKSQIVSRFKLWTSVIIVAAMWIGFLCGQGGKYANVFSQRFFDKSLFILPIFSVMIIALGFCIEYRKWLMLTFIMILNALLFVGLFITISVWTVIMVDNHTSHPLTAVSIDSTHDIVRVIKLPPETKRAVAITESENLECVADNKYHITIYDESGNIYRQETVRSGDVERIHVINLEK